MGASDLLFRLLEIICSVMRGVCSFVLAFGPGGRRSTNGTTGRTVTFDDGRAVLVGKQIAEGGFSFVFEARDVSSATAGGWGRGGGGGGGGGWGRRRAKRRLYALKRVHCGDEDIVNQCRREAGVHRTFDHPSIMPLLGMAFESSPSKSSKSSGRSGAKAGAAAGRKSRTGGTNPDLCYMLFPYVPRSLRGDITDRRLLDDDVESESRRRPYSKREALSIFAGVVDAVRTMHDAGLSHRDVKVENVLLKDDGGEDGDADHDMGGGAAAAAAAATAALSKSLTRGGTDRSRTSATPVPILMDFGSAGPLTIPLRTRPDVLRVAEDAARHTTLPYRAPELFDGGVRHGPAEKLDYGKADVWSLGCVLFAIMYGSSPFEVEWRLDGSVRIVDCTHLKVLGPVPFPPAGSAADGRYGDDVKDLVRWMLNQARAERPSAVEVAERVGRLLGSDGGGGGGTGRGTGGSTWSSKKTSIGEMDPFDSIVSRQSRAV